MRLWHKDLIKALPRKQLIGQWRECCAAAKSIAEKGTPNHLLVNKIMDYPLAHFVRYCREVHAEMLRRGITANWSQIGQYISDPDYVEHSELFNKWHTPRYLLQCIANLQEKYDCGAISDDEWLITVQMAMERLEAIESEGK